MKIYYLLVTYLKLKKKKKDHTHTYAHTITSQRHTFLEATTNRNFKYIVVYSRFVP